MFKNEYERNMTKIIDKCKHDTKNVPIDQWSLWIIYSNLNNEYKTALNEQFNIVLKGLVDK